MDHFTQNKVEGQGKICFMFLGLPPFSSPRSLLIFLIRKSLLWEFSRVFLFRGATRFFSQCKDVCFHRFPLRVSALQLISKSKKNSVLVMSPCCSASPASDLLSALFQSQRTTLHATYPVHSKFLVDLKQCLLDFRHRQKQSSHF